MTVELGQVTFSGFPFEVCAKNVVLNVTALFYHTPNCDLFAFKVNGVGVVVRALASDLCSLIWLLYVG